MNFHEYQAKELFAEYGIPVPAGQVARSGEEAVLDYALLARSDLLVHNLSSLSEVARFSVPESIRI